MSRSSAETSEKLEALGVLAIVRTESTEGLVEAARALGLGGVFAIEVTLSVHGALDGIRLLAKECPEVLLGAGTVTTPEQVEEVVDAGARYVVSPIFSRAVIARAKRLDVPVVPGCFTPTEMFEATAEGADFVKLFPAAGLGSRFLKDLRQPLPNLKVIPTGGISPENAGDWIAAGAALVGAGNALVEPGLVKRRDFATLTERARAFRRAVEEARRLV